MILACSYLCYDDYKIMVFKLLLICFIYYPGISILLKQGPSFSPVYLLVCLAILGMDSGITFLKHFGAQIVLELASKRSFKLLPCLYDITPRLYS